MIGRLRGRLLELQPPFLLLDVAGVGYEIEAPMSTIYGLPQTGQELSLHTHFVVREDAQLLFGFATSGERQMFRELLRINGVGAKIALAVLSSLSVDELIRLIEDADAAQLTRVPGIGKKTAERMLLELRGRIERFDRPAQAGAMRGGGLDTEAEDALQALGYSAAEARRLLKQVDPGLNTVQDIIRAALKKALK